MAYGGSRAYHSPRRNFFFGSISPSPGLASTCNPTPGPALIPTPTSAPVPAPTPALAAINDLLKQFMKAYLKSN